MWIDSAALLLHNRSSHVGIKVVAKVSLKLSHSPFYNSNLSPQLLQLCLLRQTVGQQFANG
jgi:hypothetical protein